MSVIETSHIDTPRNDAQCILSDTYSIDIIDGEGRMITLDARAVLNLMDFLSDWRREIKQACAQVMQAHDLADEHGFTINRTGARYYSLFWPNGQVYQDLLTEGELLDAVQRLIHRQVPAQTGKE